MFLLCTEKIWTLVIRIKRGSYSAATDQPLHKRDQNADLPKHTTNKLLLQLLLSAFAVSSIVKDSERECYLKNKGQ